MRLEKERKRREEKGKETKERGKDRRKEKIRFEHDRRFEKSITRRPSE